MAITLTGNKYTGTLTSVGTTTLTDSAATFTTSDFAYNIPRMIWLFRSGVPVAFARSILASSSTVIVLDSPFVDYDGDEVTQVIGDTYYVSLDHNDVATTGWAVSGNVVTVTDQVFYGTSGSYTSLFLHMDDVVLETIGITVANPNNSLFVGLGGCVSYGNPIDVKGRITGNRCIANNVSSTTNNGFGCKNLAFTQMHFGTKIIDMVNNPGGTSSSSFTPGHWQVFMNCEMVNCNLTSPAGGGPWTSRESFQRVINPISVAGQTNALNLRWSNGYIEGGSFSNPGGGLSPFGADANGTYEIGGASGKRLAVYASAKNNLFRSNVSNTYTVNFTNLLTQDSFKNTLTGLGPNYNTNSTLNFIWKDKYSGLTNGTKVYVEDTNDTQVFSETVGISGETSEINLTYQTRTFPTTSTTSDTFYNPWNAYFYQYGYGIITSAIDVLDDTLAGRTVKNINFGGPLAQVPDVLITESSKSTVDAYTTINNSRELYDRQASYVYDNFGTYMNLFVGRTGTQIDLTDKELVIDSTASLVFTYSDPTITIKSSTFTGGATATTGFVTVQGATALDGGTFDCNINYESSETTLTDVTCSGVIDFTTAGTYTIDGGSINEVTNSSGGAVILNLINGASITTNTGPTITINEIKNISITNIVSGSRLHIYNITTDTVIYNDVIAGTSYSDTYNEGDEFTEGDKIRVLIKYQSGATAKLCFVQTVIAGTSGWSVLADQQDDTVYNANGIDGSTVTEFSGDVPNLEVDVSDGDGSTTVQRLYAWYVYYTTTAEGIVWCSGITADDEYNYKIDTALLDLHIQNTSTNPTILYGARLYRDDNTSIFTTGNGPIQHDPDKAYLADSTTINRNIINTQALVISRNNK